VAHSSGHDWQEEQVEELEAVRVLGPMITQSAMVMRRAYNKISGAGARENRIGDLPEFKET
jgi:hypothetical protein